MKFFQNLDLRIAYIYFYIYSPPTEQANPKSGKEKYR